MAVINKKCIPELFQAVLDGRKKFELRLNDCDVSEGDTLVLREWDPAKQQYTGRELGKTVSYVLKVRIGDTFWSEEEINEKGLQVLSLD